jgi:hypothetical protein
VVGALTRSGADDDRVRPLFTSCFDGYTATRYADIVIF